MFRKYYLQYQTNTKCVLVMYARTMRTIDNCATEYPNETSLLSTELNSLRSEKHLYSNNLRLGCKNFGETHK